MLPRLDKILFTQTILISIFSRPILQASEEGLCSTKQDFGIIDLRRRETSTEEIYSRTCQIYALLDVVDEIDFSMGIGSVDIGKFNGRSAMAAVKENCEPGLSDHRGDYGFVKRVTIDLSMLLKVDWAYGIIEASFVSIFAF